jgi:hypothetical protein
MASFGMLRRVVLTRATWRNIPEDAILHSHHRENHQSYREMVSLNTCLSNIKISTAKETPRLNSFLCSEFSDMQGQAQM